MGKQQTGSVSKIYKFERDNFAGAGCFDLAATFPELHKYIYSTYINDTRYIAYILSYSTKQEITSIYEMLGLAEDATPEQLRARYKELAKETFPDTKEDPEEKVRFGKIFSDISNLYEIIGYAKEGQEGKLERYNEWLETARKNEERIKAEEITFENAKGWTDRVFSYMGKPIQYPNYLGQRILEAYPYYATILFGNDISIWTQICLDEKLEPDKVKSDYMFAYGLNRQNFSMKNLMNALIYKHGNVGTIAECQDEIAERGHKGREEGWREQLKVDDLPAIKYNPQLEEELFNRTIGMEETIRPSGRNLHGRMRLEKIGGSMMGKQYWPLYRVVELKGNEVISGDMVMMDLRGVIAPENALQRMAMDDFLYKNLSPAVLATAEDRRIADGLYFMGRPMMDDSYNVSFYGLTDMQRQIITKQKQREEGQRGK